MTQAQVIVRYLTRHRGKAFCAECLARKVFGMKEVTSTAIFQAEGLGARRHQALCAACGRRRLVSEVSDRSD
jgi:hypothetical protein